MSEVLIKFWCQPLETTFRVMSDGTITRLHQGKWIVRPNFIANIERKQRDTIITINKRNWNGTSWDKGEEIWEGII